MIAARNVHKIYEKRTGLWSKALVRAVNGVTLEIRPGETVGLVGESGCGKSTLGRCIAGMEPLTEGQIVWRQRDVSRLTLHEMRLLRKEVQLIFQDPYDALNPILTVEQLVTEPLIHLGIGSASERSEKAAYWLERVGLAPEHAGRYPGELSRGQCQRVNIARAFILEPGFVICDEIISALDVSVGAQILNLLLDLQEERGCGYLFISHDLARVMQISHKIAVMKSGSIVEVADSRRFHLEASHPYTRSLIAAVPKLLPR
ncbi:ATP-binding cassette domain-containing protein [Paenibacillus hamazuiensis]|uniref:ATP-binding cassette domain-containing protein n=1 Tax=Paenibacillus hamazuiensis TaxID=2936508 RepID=UPI00200C5E99|nr:ATP-binding cassette domain-containing protein [Paenibacillus hamazuiensis]